MTRRRRLSATAAFGLLLISRPVLHAQTPIQITEFPIGGNPIPLARGSDGNYWTWFSGTLSVGRMTPTGALTGFLTPVAFPGATPGHCVDGRDEGMWCASFGQVVRVSESDGTATTFVPPPSSAADLTFGPDGALWFTDPSTNQIGRLTVSGAITEYPLPPAFDPRSITVGSDGALWFTGLTGAVGRLDRTGAGFLSYSLPAPPEPSGGIVSGPDGRLWFGLVRMNAPIPHTVARLTLSGQLTEFPLLNPSSSGVLDVTAGPDAAVWFTDEQADAVGRLTTAGVLTSYPLSPLSGPVGITVGFDRDIWFTELSGRIGRISGGPLGAAAIPTLDPAALGILALALGLVASLLLRRV
jgi:virginiamycin B lyase